MTKSVREFTDGTDPTLIHNVLFKAWTSLYKKLYADDVVLLRDIPHSVRTCLSLSQSLLSLVLKIDMKILYK